MRTPHAVQQLDLCSNSKSVKWFFHKQQAMLLFM
jgi:hypothetical protein